MAGALDYTAGVTGGVITSVLSAALAIGPATQVLAYQDPGPPNPQGAQAPTRFRSFVDVVSVAAVVRDRKGRFVSDLSQADFEVIDGGERRKILDFRAEEDGPVRLALLVDISGSMRMGGKVVDARQAANHVFSALRRDDKAAVFAFDTQVDQLTGFTSSRAELEAGFAKAAKPYGQTSLYDAIALVSRAVVEKPGPGGMKTAATLPHRTAVVVITDGVDTRSRMTPAQVSAIASGIDVPVYIIAVVTPIDDPRNREPKAYDVTPTLQDLARWTGGEAFVASVPAHASVAARQVVDELRHQYVLAFESAASRGWRSLQIRSREGLIVRARGGYGAGTE
jgi:VWFA-related protein